MEMTDRVDDSCASSFQLLVSLKKKNKKKNKLRKINSEMNEKSVNSSLHPSLSSDPSSVFPLHVDSQDTEESQTEQQKSKRCKKDTRETSDSQLETSWVVKESNQDDAVGTVTLKKKRKRKHRSSEQDGVNECYIPKTPEEASSLPEADYLEEVGGSCEITTKKKKKEEEEVAKILSKDGFLVKDNMEAGGKYGNSQQYHVLQKSPLSEPEELIQRVRTLSDSAQKEEGISEKFSRFSKQEKELLRKNMEAFLEESGISSAEKLLFTNRFPEEKADLTRLKQNHMFGLKIAEGIPRPWTLVYYRARKMFDPQNYNEKPRIHGQETTVSSFGAITEMTEGMDDSCASSFQLFGSPKKKNKLGKLNREMNEQSVNPSLHSSFFPEPSSIFPLHIDSQDEEDNRTQQQETRSRENDTADDSCAGSFQLLGSLKKKKKRKSKLGKLDREMNKQSVSPSLHSPFFSEHSPVFPLHIDSQDKEDNQTQQQETRSRENDTADDSCAGSFQLLGSLKKKKKRKSKLGKLDREMNEQPVSPSLHSSSFSEHSLVFPLCVDSQDTEDNQTQQQKSKSRGEDTADDSCAGSFQLLGSPEKKKKKKNKLEKLNREMNDQSVNPSLHSSFFPESSSVFPLHVDSQDKEDNQNQQKKSKSGGKDTADDSCAGSFQLLGSSEKKKKKKNKLGKFNREMNDQSVNPSLHSSSFSEHSPVFPLCVDSQDKEDNQTQQQKSKSRGNDTADDSWASSSEKKKKKKNKLGKFNRVMNDQSVNPSLHSSSFSEHSSVFPLHVDSQDKEDNQTQQQKSKSGGNDTADDSCAGSFQLLGSPKKKKKLQKLNEKINEQSVNPFSSPSFSSDHSSVFSLHVDSQDTEGNQTEQQKSKRCKKDTRETSDSQLENSCVVKESNLDDVVGTVTLKKKRKRKHRSSEQDDVSECYIPKTPEEASSLPEANHLEEVGGSCEITTKKKEEEVVAKVLSNEQVKAKEASVGRPDFASDLKETQEYIFVSLSQEPPKPQDGVFLQNKIGEKLSIPDLSARLSSPTAQKKLCKHKKQPSVSSSTGNSDATKDGLLVTDTVEADGNHNNSQQYHIRQQKSPVCGHRDETASSSSNDPVSEPLILDKGFLKTPHFPMQNRQTIIQELEEFIPHVRTLSDSSIKQLALRDLPRFKHFKKQGISVRFGRFSKQENELLRKNMEAFLEESGISSAEKLLFSNRFPEEQAHLMRLKRDRLFGLKIAEGIPRPWRLVYYRAKKMFDPRNYNGKYSNKEKEKLKKYQSLHGNEWKKMSELMNRSSHSLHLKYDEMKSKFNSGAWSKEEIKKLLDTLKEILWAKVKGLDSTQKPKNTDQAMLLRENLYKGIPWFQVEAKVGTRRWKQCKRKWLYIVTRKMSHGMMKNHGLENLKFKINVIERLYELDVEDIEDVDWDDLSRIIGNVPPDYVRNRFYKIKSMYVPQWSKKTFSEIIDYLHKNILPNLRSKVAGRETKEVATEGGGLKTVFKFNEIFRDDDDLIDEDDEEEEGRNH